jgi:hypothetical protein
MDRKLQQIMRDIHASCVQHGKTNGFVNYMQGPM